MVFTLCVYIQLRKSHIQLQQVTKIFFRIGLYAIPYCFLRAAGFSFCQKKLALEALKLLCKTHFMVDFFLSSFVRLSVFRSTCQPNLFSFTLIVSHQKSNLYCNLIIIKSLKRRRERDRKKLTIREANKDKSSLNDCWKTIGYLTLKCCAWFWFAFWWLEIYAFYLLMLRISLKFCATNTWVAGVSADYMHTHMLLWMR